MSGKCLVKYRRNKILEGLDGALLQLIIKGSRSLAYNWQIDQKNSICHLVFTVSWQRKEFLTDIDTPPDPQNACKQS